MQLVAYVRVSTSKQELGPEAQREMITAYAAKHGHTVVDWYEEHISGAADIDKRHVLMDALSALSDSMGLVVAKRDRLSRDTTMGGMIKYLVRKKGAVVLSADSNGNGSSDPYADMLDGMLEVFAQFERALIRMRIVAALDVKRQRGEKLGGKAPYGFRLAADGVSLEECPEEQAIIRQAKTLRTEGYTIRQIVEKLGPVSRVEKPFTVAAVYKMVTLSN
jgi:DNA invertase Pin-like site-specific DNA recombinase